MSEQRTVRSETRREVLVLGGSDADRQDAVSALAAASFTIVDHPPADGYEPVSVQIRSDDLAPADATNWMSFADGIINQPGITAVTLFLVNLDHFQRLRSMLGHGVTEQLLQELAGRLETAIQSQNEARLLHAGSDEFAILVPHMERGAAATEFGNSLLEVISKPYSGLARQAYVTARIGAVFYPEDAGDIESLMRHASGIVHRESRQGRNTVHFYARGAAMMAKARFELEAELHQAIRNGDLEVHYQPQISLSTGRITGAEALVRWRRPDLGTVPAEVFVGLAEDLGLIAELGTWVLTTAAAECRRWQQTAHEPIRVSINISSYQFRHFDMVAVVQAALEETGLDPDFLTLEVTESLVLSDIESTLISLKELRAMGIHVELDDFGTGYSSLSYLKTLALDALKLDRSFIQGLPDDPGDLAVTEAVVRMARALRLTVTAEGVETEAQRDCLAKLGCHTYQGFLASVALPANDFIKLLAERAAP